MVACINAVGHVFPPAFIFPRVHYKHHLLNGAPTGSLGLSNASGWINNELFIKVLEHFLQFMKISKINPGLLVLDYYKSGISFKVIKIAQ